MTSLPMTSCYTGRMSHFRPQRIRFLKALRKPLLVLIILFFLDLANYKVYNNIVFFMSLCFHYIKILQAGAFSLDFTNQKVYNYCTYSHSYLLVAWWDKQPFFFQFVYSISR